MSDNDSKKILKLRFPGNEPEKKEKDEAEPKFEEKKHTTPNPQFENHKEPKKTSRAPINPIISLKGVPKIITPTKSTLNKSSPFRKKTFIPKNIQSGNKFTPKPTPKPNANKPSFKPFNSQGSTTARTGNMPFNKNKKPLFGNSSANPLISSLNNPFLDKKKPFTSNNSGAKKKKTIKKESFKPKNTIFSGIIGNNFIGKIEDSTLEDSEYFKIKKNKKYNNNSNKNKIILKKTIELDIPISLKELASKLSMKLEDIMYQANYIGCTDINENNEYDIEILEMIATSLGHIVIRKDSLKQEKLEIFNINIDELSAEKRIPIVAIIGHIDHGKTSLLDKIRKSNIAKSEIGDITQKIAAYTITTKNGDITFLDTPGHAAFSNMRKRGLKINDITILVISAVEGLKEQTIESIKQIKNSETELIIALTKSDLPNTIVDKIKQDLAKYEILVKDYGGDIEMIEVSSLTGHNIDLLLQTILTYAELMDLKANRNTAAKGVVLESRIDTKAGIFTTLLIKQGTLNIADICATQSTFGKIKAIWDDNKKSIKKAGPGIAVEVLGFNDSSTPGEKFTVVKEHEEAIALSKKHTDILINASPISLDDFFAETLPTLHLVINAETQGGLEAIEEHLKTLNTTHSTYKIVKKSIGKIKESDIDIAQLSNSTILTYGLTTSKDIASYANTKNVSIIASKVIYEIDLKIQEELEKLITLIQEEVYLGTAIVKRLFKSSKIGNIAGCIVDDGKIVKGGIAKIFRKDQLIFEGKIESLKRNKDDAKEVKNGLECGIFANFKEIQEEDLIKCYKIEYKKPNDK